MSANYKQPATRTYLVALNFASVQGFLEAARRSRDLWYGSLIASELSKAMARRLVEVAAEAELIFPAPAAPSVDLLPGSDFQVANKVVAFVTLHEGETPNGLVRKAKEAAQVRWGEIANGALKAARQTIPKALVDPDRWERQIGEPFDIYAAWLEVSGDFNYREATARLELLLAQRKLSRMFAPSPLDSAISGLEKSSLDGRRETVLADGDEVTRRRIGLKENEALDAIGLVKRLGGRFDPKAERFTPLTRIALDPWVRGLSDFQLSTLNDVLKGCNQLRAEGFLSAVEDSKGLHYDGQLLYPFRLDAAEKELEEMPEALAELERLRESLRSVWRERGVPPTAVAILAADGDEMGKTIRNLDSKARHRALSQALAGVASGMAQEIRGFQGHQIYAGGDDLLALVPVDRCLACAGAVRERFVRSLAGLGLPNAPTLSLGLAVGHMLEPMGSLLHRARGALRLAKGEPHPDLEGEDFSPRNALAISLKPRSGVELVWRANFNPEQPPHVRMQAWVDAFQEDRLAMQTPYRLRTLAERIEGVVSDRDKYAQVLPLLLPPLLKRSGLTDDQLQVALVERAVAGKCALKELIAELLIARRLAGKE